MFLNRNSCCKDFNLAKLQNFNGSVVWTSYIQGTVDSGANVLEVEAIPGSNDILCIVEGGGGDQWSLIRVDNTGSEVWSVSLGSTPGLLYRGCGANASRIYYVEDYAVTCLDLSGAVQWTYSSTGNKIITIHVADQAVLIWRTSSPYTVVLNGSTGAVSTSSTSVTNLPVGIFYPFGTPSAAQFLRYSGTRMQVAQIASGSISISATYTSSPGWDYGRSRWRNNAVSMLFTAANRAGNYRNGTTGSYWDLTSLSGSTASTFNPTDIECDSTRAFITTDLQDYDPGSGRYNTNVFAVFNSSGSFSWAARLEFGKDSDGPQQANSVAVSNEGYVYVGGNGGKN